MKLTLEMRRNDNISNPRQLRLLLDSCPFFADSDEAWMLHATNFRIYQYTCTLTYRYVSLTFNLWQRYAGLCGSLTSLVSVVGVRSAWLPMTSPPVQNLVGDA